MFKAYIAFCLKMLKSKRSNSFFIISGISITTATVILLITLLTSRENPNNHIKDADRTIVMDNSIRNQEGNTWSSGLNFRLIKEHIEVVDGIESAAVFQSERVQHWVNDVRIESQVLYADHRFTNFFNLKFIEGSFFNEEDYKAESKVIALSERSSKLFFGNEQRQVFLY